MLVRCSGSWRGADESCQHPALLPWEKAVLLDPNLVLSPRLCQQEAARGVHRHLSAVTPGARAQPAGLEVVCIV